MIGEAGKKREKGKGNMVRITSIRTVNEVIDLSLMSTLQYETPWACY